MVTGESVAALATAEQQQAAQSEMADARSRDWPDAAIPAVLALASVVYRWHFPPDGLFFDDGWQAFGAVKGSFGDVLTAGQTQPVFGLVLMVWSRVVGYSAPHMITPALLAGVIGPPALYLVLRRSGTARSIAALLGAALAVCTTHIVYSGRVKVYTSEVLVVLLLAVAVPWLAKRSWTLRTAVVWFSGSMILAGFSPFALLATVAATIVLVLHPQNDLRVRVVTVAAQAAGLSALMIAIARTHNGHMLVRFFDRYDAYLPNSLNPVTFVRETFDHLTRITAAFPGGPSWFAVVTLVVASAGLALAATRGNARGIVARFMIAMVLLAVIGSIAQQVPFGPASPAARLTMWMSPIIAFGLAEMLQRTRQSIAERGGSGKLVFDALTFGIAALLLVIGFGSQPAYPHGGALAASRQAMQEIGPRDAVFVTPAALFSFALDSGTPVRLEATPDRELGFVPRFSDKRVHAFSSLSKAQLPQLDKAVKAADRVFIVDSGFNLPTLKQYRVQLTSELERQGFRLARTTDVNRARIITWERRR
jgi:hypothetical protein